MEPKYAAAVALLSLVPVGAYALTRELTAALAAINVALIAAGLYVALSGETGTGTVTEG